MEFVRPLKIKNKNLKKEREEWKDIQKKLQVELETLSVNNKKTSKEVRQSDGNWSEAANGTLTSADWQQQPQ